MDIGTPERYLQATWDILEGRVETGVEPTGPGMYVDPSAEIAESAVVGPRVVLGAALPGRGRGGGPRIGPARGLRGRRRARGSAARSSPPGSRSAPRRRRSTAPSSAEMKESPSLAMLDDVLAIPDHLRDALWRVESARIEAGGLGRGSWSAGWAARRSAGTWRPRRSASASPGRWPPSAATGCRAGRRRRLDGPLLELLGRDRGDARLLRGRRRGSARGGSSPAPAAPWSSGRARRGPGRRPAGHPAAARRGRLHARRRRRGRRPGRGRAPDRRPRSRTPPPSSSGAPASSRPARRRSPTRLEGALPVIYGAELTAPVARRWKTQVNENAKLQAFFSELPEADHNEICGWAGLPDGARALGGHARGRRPAPARARAASS